MPFAAVAALLAAFGCAAGPGSAGAPSVVRVVEEADGYSFRDEDGPVLFYQLRAKSLDGEYERSNYIHPLYGLDGETLTEDFPEDHRHHRGVFWTWHQVLVGSVRAGDPWLARRFSWRTEEALPLPGGGLRVKHTWFSPDYLDGDQPILAETAEVVARRPAEAFRTIDFDIRLVPLQEGVRLGGSEDDKGYGGFSVRVRMVEGLRFTAAQGRVEPQRTAAALGDWVDFSADFGGRDGPSGVAVLVHPASAGYPQAWILRSPATPSMQNPVWPGPVAALLPRGQETRLRYRLVVHRGDAASLDLDSLARAYAALP